jgi:hypothetical protein
MLLEFPVQILQDRVAILDRHVPMSRDSEETVQESGK